ncbi:hypothetical protein GAY31_17435 [Azospirillum brasilense]|nr:hypothetical protein [Azospirillum brasilense]
MTAFTSRENRDLDRWLMSLPGRDLPPSFSESFFAAVNEADKFGNIHAYERNRWDFVQGQIDRYQDLTGEVLPNPENIMGPEYAADRERQYQRVRDRFDAYRQQNPDTDLGFPDEEMIQNAAEEIGLSARRTNSAVEAQREAAGGSSAAWWGSTLGGVWGGVKDPINLMAMGLGAPAGVGILRTALIEAAAAAGSQAVIEAGTYGFKKEADPTWSGQEAARAIGGAAVGGAVIGGGVAGLVAGARKVFGGRQVPREAQDALNVLERQEEVAASSPLPPTVAGDVAHINALTKAAQDIEAGRPVDVQDIVREARAETPPSPTTPDRVFTSGGRAVDVEYRVVEAESLIASHDAQGGVNPQFPAELQPRDRTRIASQAQIADMAANLQPERLGRSTDAATGAPIVGPDNVVESGNGRVTAIRRAYEQGGEAADRYRAWAVQQDPTAAQMRNPVLVAVRRTDVDRATFAREANQATAARLSPTEQARADARLVNDAVLTQVRAADVTAASNRGAVRSWLDGMPASERGGLVDADGGLNQEGRRRFEGALLARAYDAPDLIGRLVEDLDNDIKAIGGALQDVAGPWAKMRAAAARGDIPSALDPSGRLLDAVRLVQRARESGQKVFDLLNQEDIFAGQVDPITGAFVRMFFRNDSLTAPAGRKSVADALAGYVDEAMAENGGGLLGRAERPGQILLGEERAPSVPIARPAEEVARAPETQDALFQQVNRLLASREIDVPTAEIVDEAGKVVALKRSAMDLMDEADRAINDAATVAACAFGVAAE